MNFTTCRLALFALVFVFFVIWNESADRDVAVAQARTGVTVTRIYTGSDGLAHAEDIDLKLDSRGVSEMLKATGAEFSVRPPTPGANAANTAASSTTDPGWHTGPARQFVITLNGVETSRGSDAKHPQGVFALQFGAGPEGSPLGSIKWRKVQVQAL